MVRSEDTGREPSMLEKVWPSAVLYIEILRPLLESIHKLSPLRQCWTDRQEGREHSQDVSAGTMSARNATLCLNRWFRYETLSPEQSYAPINLVEEPIFIASFACGLNQCNERQVVVSKRA